MTALLTWISGCLIGLAGRDLWRTWKPAKTPPTVDGCAHDWSNWSNPQRIEGIPGTINPWANSISYTATTIEQYRTCLTCNMQELRRI